MVPVREPAALLNVVLVAVALWLGWQVHTRTLERDDARYDYARCRGGAE